ncbi:hypothetical protein AB1E18_019512 [Capra hircus]
MTPTSGVLVPGCRAASTPPQGLPQPEGPSESTSTPCRAQEDVWGRPEQPPPPLRSLAESRTASLAASKSAPPGAARGERRAGPGGPPTAPGAPGPSPGGACPEARFKQAAARAEPGTQARAGGAAALKLPPHQSARRAGCRPRPLLSRPQAELRGAERHRGFLGLSSRGRAPQPPLLPGLLGTPASRAQASRDTHPGGTHASELPATPSHPAPRSSGAGKEAATGGLEPGARRTARLTLNIDAAASCAHQRQAESKRPLVCPSTAYKWTHIRARPLKEEKMRKKNSLNGPQSRLDTEKEGLVGQRGRRGASEQRRREACAEPQSSAEDRPARSLRQEVSAEDRPARSLRAARRTGLRGASDRKSARRTGRRGASEQRGGQAGAEDRPVKPQTGWRGARRPQSCAEERASLALTGPLRGSPQRPRAKTSRATSKEITAGPWAHSKPLAAAPTGLRDPCPQPQYHLPPAQKNPNPPTPAASRSRGDRQFPGETPVSDTPRQEPWLDGSQTERCADLGPKTLQVWPQPRSGEPEPGGAAGRAGGPPQLPSCPAALWVWEAGTGGSRDSLGLQHDAPTPVVTMFPPGPSKGHCPGTQPCGGVQDPCTGGTHSGLQKDVLPAGRAESACRVRARGAEVPPPQADGRRPGGSGPSQQAALSPEMLTPAQQRAVATVTTGRHPLRVPVPPATSPCPRSPGAGAEGERSSPAEVPWPTPRARASQPRIQAEAFPKAAGPRDPSATPPKAHRPGQRLCRASTCCVLSNPQSEGPPPALLVSSGDHGRDAPEGLRPCLGGTSAVEPLALVCA